QIPTVAPGGFFPTAPCLSNSGKILGLVGDAMGVVVVVVGGYLCVPTEERERESATTTSHLRKSEDRRQSHPPPPLGPLPHRPRRYHWEWRRPCPPRVLRDAADPV